jgi:hypothetical protein
LDSSEEDAADACSEDEAPNDSEEVPADSEEVPAESEDVPASSEEGLAVSEEVAAGAADSKARAGAAAWLACDAEEACEDSMIVG